MPCNPSPPNNTGRPYVALLLYLWVVWGRLRGCTLCAPWIRAVQRLDNRGRDTGCRTAERGDASVTRHDPSLNAFTSTMSGRSPCQCDVALGHPVVAAVNRPDMSEALIGAVGKPSKPAPLRCSSKPTPPMHPEPIPSVDCSPGSHSVSTAPISHRPRAPHPPEPPTTTPRPKLTHGYDRRTP